MGSGSAPGISGLDSPRLEEKGCWSRHRGSGSHATKGEDRQRRFVQAAGPSGKIGGADCLTNMGWTLGCPGQAEGDALTKQGLFRHSGQCWNRQRRRNRRSRQNRRPVLTMSPDDL